MSIHQSLIVIQSHRSNYPNPIHLHEGERVTLGEEDSEYPDWVWVTSQRGNEGWAPLQYLEPVPNADQAVVKNDYIARELDTVEDEELLLHYAVSGWGWVENRAGQKGWVPLETTRRKGG